MGFDLASIKKGREVTPPRIIVYGVNGIGKSTFAAQSGGLFIPTEDGLGLIDAPRFPQPQTLADVYECIKAAHETDYPALILDTLDNLEAMIHAAVAKKAGKTHISDIGYQAGYESSVGIWAELLSKLDELRLKKGMMIILTTHSVVKLHQAPDVDPYDQYIFDLHKKSASVLRDWADVVLFANYKTFTKKVGEGFNTQTQGLGSGERVCFTEERPAHWAKNRYRLPYELPFEWSAFSAALNTSIAGVK